MFCRIAAGVLILALAGCVAFGSSPMPGGTETSLPPVNFRAAATTTAVLALPLPGESPVGSEALRQAPGMPASHAPVTIFAETPSLADRPVEPSASPASFLPVEATAVFEPSVTPENIPALKTASPGLGNEMQPEYLVLISLDGCRPDYLDLAEMPNLKTLMDTGATYTGAWIGALPSNTPPGHTQISTGVFPRHNGILSFKWYDLAADEIYRPTTLTAVNQGEMARIVAQSGVPTLSALIKDRYPGAVVAALSSQKYYAAQALGVGPADFILYAEELDDQVSSSSQDTGQVGMLGIEPPWNGQFGVAAVTGYEPGKEFMQDPALQGKISQPGDDNLYVFLLAQALFKSYQPRALLINLPETDSWGHQVGGITHPDIMRRVMQATDRGLGELMKLYRDAGLFDRTLWVVTSDHGMTPSVKVYGAGKVRQAMGLEREDGQLDLPHIYLLDPDRSISLANRMARAALPGITGVYVRTQSGGNSAYQPAEFTQASLPSELNDAYLYLLSTFAGPYSPNIVLTSEENVCFVSQGGSIWKGYHGANNWANQHILLILSGPGVRRGVSLTFPARLVDIAPTIVRLMGLQQGGMDGAVLSDALLSPRRQDIEAQTYAAAFLTRLRNALRTRASRIVNFSPLVKSGPAGPVYLPLVQKTSFTLARPLPDTSDGIHVFNDQLVPWMSEAQYQFAAAHYDGTQKMTRSAADHLRTYSPDFVILHYRLGLGLGYRSIQSACSPTGDWLQIIEGEAWVQEWPGNANVAESWFYHWPEGSTTRVLNCDWGWYLMNLDDPAWRSYWTDEVLRQLRANDNDGIFADSFSVPNYLGADRYNPPLPDLDASFESQWVARLEDFAAYVQQGALAGYHFIPNAGYWVTSRETTDYSLADGVMIEGLGEWGQGKYFDLSDWQLQMNRVLNLVGQDKAVLAQQYIDTADVNERMFVLGSYLLIKGRYTYLNLDIDVEPEWFPEYDIPIGSPVGGIPADVDTLWNASWGVYARSYTNGLVLVNPSNTTVTAILGKTYYRAVPSGGGLVPVDGDISAWTVGYTPISSVTLSPNQAAVLLNTEP